MTRVAVLVVVTFLSQTARAEDPGLAVGTSVGWLKRADYGAASRFYLAPELSAQLRYPLLARVSFRPALRLGYVGFQQPDMPASLALRERDVTLGAEAAVSYDAIFTPWIALGALVIGRDVAVETAPPVSVAGAHLGGRDVLAGAYAQGGLGVALRRGAIVIGPSARLQWVYGDPRAHWRFALDGTFRVF